MLLVQYADNKMATGKKVYRGIVCYLCITLIVIYVLYNFGINITSSRVTDEVDVEHSLTKTTFRHIKERFSKIITVYRRQKKMFVPSKIVSDSETTHELSYRPCSSNLFLLILIPSRPKSVNNRIAVRLTWAHGTLDGGSVLGNFSYRTFFVINGRSKKRVSLTKEMRKFGDILQIKSRTKLVIVPAIQHLLASNCNSKFVLVLSNDSFVNVPELSLLLSRFAPGVQYAGKVKQSKVSIGKISNTPKKLYKLYCAEGAYVLAGNVLKNILNASKVIPPPKNIRNEAIYVGMLAFSLGVKPYNDATFNSLAFEDVNINDIDPCKIKKEIFVRNVFRVRHILMYTRALVVGKQPCAMR